MANIWTLTRVYISNKGADKKCFTLSTTAESDIFLPQVAEIYYCYIKKVYSCAKLFPFPDD